MLAPVPSIGGARIVNGNMKQTLPWSVTGIPPEARDVARAAATREGLSVGDWLTRRILAESARNMAPEPRHEQRHESRHEPQPEAYRNRDDEMRRDHDDLVGRLTRTEVEADSSIKKIDDALRAVARRLEITERSQTEANRAMSAAASEINAAARDQAQAFNHLTERIDRVERGADTTSLRDAVRGLHQGLSRLADQIAKSANDTSGQITTMASNMEVLAGKVNAAREETGRVAQTFDDRVNALADRIKLTEERAQIGNGGLQQTVVNLENRLNSAEERMQDAMGRHLGPIERTLDNIAARLERTEGRNSDAETNVQSHLRELNRRLEAAEQQSRAALEELRSGLGDTSKRIDELHAAAAAAAAAAAVAAAAPPPAPQPAPDPFAPAVAAAQPASSSFDLPPFPDAPPFPSSFYPQRQVDEFPAIPPDEVSELFAAPPADSEEPRQPVHDYLTQARRAAQAAAETNQGRGRVPLNSMNMAYEGQSSARKKSRRVSPATALGLLLLLGGVAGFLLTRGMGQSQMPSVPTADGGVRTPASVTGPAGNFAPQTPAATGVATPEAADNQIFNGTAGSYNTQPPRDALPARPLQRSDAVPPRATEPPPAPPAPQVASNTPPKAAAPANIPAIAPPQASNAPAGPTPLDRLMAKARANDTKAALVLGLKYVDGDGVAASDSEAVRWLRKAAEAGEPVAQYRLGTLYEKGRGMPADAKQATYWYEQAAKKGNRKAMHNLAVAFADGAGREKNFTEAARWFRAAADLGLADSQFNLAVLYERGLGVTMSLPDAYKWYVIAAGQGDAESKTRMDALATQLPPNDRTNADKAAKSFVPQALDRAANDPPTLAEVAP